MEGRTMTVPNRTGREETEESREKTPAGASNWDRVVDLIHTAFREGRLAEESTWQAVALIPKGGKSYRGIGLMEVMWKLVAENFKLPARSLYKLPRLPPHISGGLRHRYCHPRGQNSSAVSGLEGGSPVCDLPGPAQGVWRLGQVQVP